MQPDQDVINKWTGSAPYWEKNREIIRGMFAPITQALIEDAQVVRAQTVLDVATGPGEPALSVASVVGPGGRVCGVDPVAEMVAAARRAAERLAIGNVDFEVAFADQMPFAGDTFDAVISRFGVMFFPSPIDGVREMLRVLKPGRKMALAVWHYADENPFHHALSEVMDRFIEPEPVPPDAPDAFRFAEPGKLLEIVRRAGVAGATERLLRFHIEATLPMEEYLTLRIEMSEKLRSKMASFSDEVRKEVRQQALASLGEYATKGGVSFPAQVLILSGTKAS